MSKRIISLLLSLVVMATFVIPINAFADEETTHTYSGNGYEITYNIKGSWTGNQNIEVAIHNTGSESILNWTVKYDAHGVVNGLWNATVNCSDSTKYLIKNSGYNYEILPEQSVTFGYTLSGEYMELPEKIELCSQRNECSEEQYSVSLNVSDEWDTGFVGSIVIENLGDKPLEAWKLVFDGNFEIESVWNAVMLSHIENTYTISNDITTTPIRVGEKKEFGFKATKNAESSPEMTNILLSEIVINDDFTTIDIPEIELAVSGFANYLEEENAINLFWYTNIENGSFEIQESYDAESYITTAVLQNEYTYKYSITDDFDKRFFRIIQTTDDGQVAETPWFYLEKTDNGYETKFIDSDEDGLPDFVEQQIGTDINNADTDSDGLTDYQEYYILGTDPLVFDSVTAGVSDADADCDSDGLSNIRELELGTKPFNPDTDNDGLTDGDEVNIHGTDPLKYDTDDDGISDGDEITLGTDPLSPTTDGIADTERTFVQTVEADDKILEEINTDSNPFEMSLEITAAGNVHTNLTVKESGYMDAMFNWSILGTCPELVYDNACNVDEVVVKFKIGDEYVNNSNDETTDINSEFSGVKRYNIFRYFEEDNILLPIKTDVDVESNTISATTDELGTYCVIDMAQFIDYIANGNESAGNIETEVTENTDEIMTYSLPTYNSPATETASTVSKNAVEFDDDFNVVFMYDDRDCGGSSAEDYDTFYNNACKTAEYIMNKSPQANIYLIQLKSSGLKDCYVAQYETAAAGYVEEDRYDFHDIFLLKRGFNSNAVSGGGSKTDLEKARKNVVVSDAFDFVLNGIKDKDSKYTKIVNTEIPTFCFSYFNEVNAVYRESNGYDLLSQLVKKNVNVSLIGSYDFSNYIGGYAKDLYTQTAGQYFTGYAKDSLSEEHMTDEQKDYSRSRMSRDLIRYIYGLGETEIPPIEDTSYRMVLSTGLVYAKLDAPITISYFNASRSITKKNHDSDTFKGFADTDKDGLYDFEEINFESSLIKHDNGKIELPTMNDCIDYYGIKEGKYYVSGGLDRYMDESNEGYLAEYIRCSFGELTVLPIKSNPIDVNGDNDGVDDIYDIEPLIGVNEWSNCICHQGEEELDGVENHHLNLCEIDGQIYYYCDNCNEVTFIPPETQDNEILSPEHFVLVSMLNELAAFSLKNEDLIKMEFMYRAIDKIRTLPQYYGKYDYCNNNGEYVSPLDYLFTDSQNECFMETLTTEYLGFEERNKAYDEALNVIKYISIINPMTYAIVQCVDSYFTFVDSLISGSYGKIILNSVAFTRTTMSIMPQNLPNLIKSFSNDKIYKKEIKKYAKNLVFKQIASIGKESEKTIGPLFAYSLTVNFSINGEGTTYIRKVDYYGNSNVSYDISSYVSVSYSNRYSNALSLDYKDIHHTSKPQLIALVGRTYDDKKLNGG